tara:strand:- start:192 stop:890 length:699 start_codon:yes stop_codon:yes gene_type:complete
MKKILVTGGNGRFAESLKKIKSNHKFFFRSKGQLDITSINSIKRNINQFKPNIVLHLAGLSRPMKIHDTNIQKSINLNVIGTCNLVNICFKRKIKLVYFSTSYVYAGTKGNYKEEDPVLPWNNYAKSKMAGELAVQMYKNSLILRVSMTEEPFVHKAAYANVKSNFMYHNDAGKLLLKVLNKKGIYNFGGKSQTVFNFIKEKNKKIRKRFSKGEFPLKQDMSLKKLKNLVKR